LNTFFQVDLEVIRTMRGKNISIGFTKNIGEFVILRKNIKKVRSLYKFCGVGLNVQKNKDRVETC